METLPANPHRVSHSAKSKGFKGFSLALCLLLPATSLLFAQSASVQLDQNGFYQIQKTARSTASVARKPQYAVISFTADPRRPANLVRVSISIDPGIPLDNGLWFTLTYKTSTELNAPSNEIYIANKSVDRISRRMEIPIGGLKDNTTYYFNLTFWNGCGGEPVAQAQYKTGDAPKGPKKVLLVLD